jgi:8-oxo-dGTP pyrophosphatase MutT (NUDIX family)
MSGLEVQSRLKAVLSQRKKVSVQDDSRRPSAVLIPVYYQSGQHYILFTRRTELVHHHKGEISFPGGGYQPEDVTLQNTALRESFEEIGLIAKDVQVLGELDDILTKSSPYIITPFVGIIQPDYAFIPSGFEIAEIIIIPVKALLEEGCRRDMPEVWLNGQTIQASVYAYQGNMIIGATARILKQFLEIFSQVTD